MIDVRQIDRVTGPDLAETDGRNGLIHDMGVML